MGNIQAGNGEIFSAVARAQQAMANQQRALQISNGVEQEPSIEPSYQPDKPWLITTISQMQEQETMLLKIKEKCQESFSASLSYVEKLKWAELNTRKFKNETETAFINSAPALQQIMFDHCPESVKIIVLINKDRALDFLQAIKTDIIGNNVLRQDFKSSGEKNQVEYIEFLKGCTCTMRNGNFTTIFELELPKSCGLDEVLNKINPQAIAPKEGFVVKLLPMKLNPGLVTRITENIECIGNLPFSLDNSISSVVLELNILRENVEQAESQEHPGKSVIVIKNCEQSDYRLWVDGSYQRALNRIRSHVLMGEGECDYIRYNVKNLKLDLYEANLVYLMKNPFKMSKSQLFSELLAFSSVLISDETFFSEITSLDDENDDDHLESFEDYFDDFAQFWQTISHLPEDVLEFSVERIARIVEEKNNGVKALSSKEVLAYYLKYLAWEIENKAGIRINLLGNTDDESLDNSNTENTPSSNDDQKRKLAEHDASTSNIDHQVGGSKDSKKKTRIKYTQED